ncbi:transposase, partial [Actinomadura sp. NPDC048955]|uniref:transposase n=1 Tax=Actinomadura sp. NPDC048955 TaxID=3158228 RepID=UPI0033FE6107
ASKTIRGRGQAFFNPAPRQTPKAGPDGRDRPVRCTPPHPPEFRRRAVELARTGDKSVTALAKSLGISQSCLSNWIRQAAIDEGHLDGLSAGEQKELVELRRKARQLELENEILKRAAAYFARENVLPK